MRRQTLMFAVLVAAGVICGCTSSTSDSLGSRLGLDKVPPQHEPKVGTDSDEFATDSDEVAESESLEPGDDF
jgi:hypothetical protein